MSKLNKFKYYYRNFYKWLKEHANSFHRVLCFFGIHTKTEYFYIPSDKYMPAFYGHKCVYCDHMTELYQQREIPY